MADPVNRTVAQNTAVEIAAHLRRLASNAEAHGWYQAASTLRKAKAMLKVEMHPADRRRHGKI